MSLSSSLCLNALAPKDARMALDAVRFAEEELLLGGHGGLRGKRLLAAFSGGADSTALLVMFCALRSHMGLDIHAAHLDHGLRDESRAEAEAAEAALFSSALFAPNEIDSSSPSGTGGTGSSPFEHPTSPAISSNSIAI